MAKPKSDKKSRPGDEERTRKVRRSTRSSGTKTPPPKKTRPTPYFLNKESQVKENQGVLRQAANYYHAQMIKATNMGDMVKAQSWAQELVRVEQLLNSPIKYSTASRR
ncbi:MAG: hypothetical protein KGL39_16435 [Patescibacteria group bacterium]|nr:hypothetical protein [Patescibacteria group bacterium]